MVNKCYAFVLFGLLIFLTRNSIAGSIAFGHGLADVIYHSVLWMITLVYIVSLTINRKDEKRLLFSNVFFTIPVIWIILSATFWRGSEYGWNGDVFYPSTKSKGWDAKNHIRWHSDIDSLIAAMKENQEESDLLVHVEILKNLLAEDGFNLRRLKNIK